MKNTYEALTEFYPTPPELIAKMLEKVSLKNVKYVLEPSAGKGDIARFLMLATNYINDSWRYKELYKRFDVENIKKKENYIIQNDVVADYNKILNGEKEFTYYCCCNNRIDIDCIELDSSLRAILNDRELNVIDDDFLKYDGEKHYDLIIMNPPFSNGAEHLLHALKIAEKSGSQIVCLLNAETIRNPYSNERLELLKQLEKYNAEYEYVAGAFISAERKTDVDVVIITVTVPSPFTSGKSKILEELDDAENFEFDEVNVSEELVVSDEIKQAVKFYKREIELGKRLISEYMAVKPYLSSRIDYGDTPYYMKASTLYLTNGKNCDELDYNKYVKAVRYKYWYQLLHKPVFLGNLTSNLKDEYFSNIQELANKEFSLSNIYKVKLDVLQRTAQGIQDRIITLFETLTYEHSMECEKNIHYYNGWKSNSAYIINKKVVVPYMRCWDDIFKRFKYNYNVVNFISDIQKVFDFLDGGETDVNMDVSYWANYYEKMQDTKNLHFKYFDVNVYKKGTIHITFTNLDVLKKLNIYGSQHKGWLPPSYGKKSYNEMTDEEKSVIDEFEGKAEYAKVYAQPDRFIVAPEKSMLALGA